MAVGVQAPAEYSLLRSVYAGGFGAGVSGLVAGAGAARQAWAASRLAAANRSLTILNPNFAPRGVATPRVSTVFDDFRAVREFRSEAEGQKAWEVYQRAASAEKGIVIGHGDAAIHEAFDGWQAFRMLNDSPVTRRMNSVTWTEDINMAWIDGAVDAGKPVRLATPFDRVYRGTVTWREIQRVISRGGRLVAE
jgi:hypothetical protein